MQKKLIALAIAGLVASPVFADVSNVTIGGKLGVGYQDWTNDGLTTDSATNSIAVDGRGVHQNTSDGNGIAIKGEEDLGGGMKAFFHLETRFDIGTGSTAAYDEASKIGIAGGFGSVEFGKVNTVMDKVGYDPGTFCNVCGYESHRAMSQTKLSNGWLYTGTFGSASIYASHHSAEAQSAKNDYAIGGAVNFGMFDVSAGYQHGANQWNNYLIAGKVSLPSGVVIASTFTQSRQYKWNNAWGTVHSGIDYAGLKNTKVNAFGLSAEIPAGPGALGLSFSHVSGKSKNVADSEAFKLATIDKFGVAYRYPITKRTKIESGVAYERFKWNDQDDSEGHGMLKNTAKSRFGVSTRLVHEF